MQHNEPLLITVAETARLLHVGRNHVYDLIAEGRLPHIRLGRVIRIPRYGLEEWIARQAGLSGETRGEASLGDGEHIDRY